MLYVVSCYSEGIKWQGPKLYECASKIGHHHECKIAGARILCGSRDSHSVRTGRAMTSTVFCHNPNAHKERRYEQMQYDKEYSLWLILHLFFSSKRREGRAMDRSNLVCRCRQHVFHILYGDCSLIHSNFYGSSLFHEI